MLDIIAEWNIIKFMMPSRSPSMSNTCGRNWKTQIERGRGKTSILVASLRLWHLGLLLGARPSQPNPWRHAADVITAATIYE